MNGWGSKKTNKKEGKNDRGGGGRTGGPEHLCCSHFSECIFHHFLKELASLTSKVKFKNEKQKLEVLVCKYGYVVSPYYTF